MKNLNGLMDKLKDLEDWDVEIKVPFQKCEDCDKILSDTELRIAPYAAELYDEYNWKFLCQSCIEQECADI